jgi:lipoic acid synthetase
LIKIQENISRKPDWLKIKLNTSVTYQDMKHLMQDNNLHTVCEEARCPNIYECWNNRTATVMILGDTCTRACGFCSVKTGKPLIADIKEPLRVANLVKTLELRHVVITSVDRDDLKDDYGSIIWKNTIKEIRRLSPDCTIEVLTPDFKGYKPSLDTVFSAKPDIFSHNVECVERISKKVRTQSDWIRTMNVLKYSVENNMLTKTGMMVGLGETDDEVFYTMDTIRKLGVEIFNVGQYLQPTKNKLKVERYVNPDMFNQYKKYGLEIGFSVVESGPLVRSSYHADEQARKYAKVN